MEKYKNVTGNSGIVSYEIQPDGIKVQFEDNTIYLYTNESAGKDNIEAMKALALAGSGLNGFINKNTKKKYALKLQ